MTSHNAHTDRLIWIDLEMTGLDTDRDSILEIATVVTDSRLNVLAEGPEFAIAHPVAVLEAMDDWNRNQHGRSGLWKRVVESQVFPTPPLRLSTLMTITGPSVSGRVASRTPAPGIQPGFAGFHGGVWPHRRTLGGFGPGRALSTQS